MRTRNVKLDANHGEIVKLFTDLGCSWLDLAKVGGGCPDGLVGIFGQSRLVEIKDGEKRPSERKLRPSQQRFKDQWKGVPIVKVETKEDAIIAVQQMGLQT